MKGKKIETSARVLSVKLDQNAGQNLLQHGRWKSNTHTGRLTACRALCYFNGFLRASERCAGTDKKAFASFCELHGTPVAIQKPHSDVLLQPLDLRRDGGLRQVKLNGSADKALSFSDGDESCQVFQFQFGTPEDEIPDTLWVHAYICLVNQNP